MMIESFTYQRMHLQSLRLKVLSLKIRYQLTILLGKQMIEEDTGENQFLQNIDSKLTPLSHVNSALKLQKIRLRNKITLMDEEQKTFLKKDKPNSVDQIVHMGRINITNKKSLKFIKPCADWQEKSQINSSLSASKHKSTNQQDIQQKRFLQYKRQLSKSINQLKSIYKGQLEGVTNINLDIKKQNLTKQELMMYYAKMLPASTHLPQIAQKHTQISSSIKPKFPKNRSQSEKSLIPVEISTGKQNIQKLSKLNKWYIDPKKRFSINKEKTLYDWKTQQGLKNVINKSNIKIPGKEINGLVNHVVEKFHRQPLFCKYSKLS